MEGQLSGFFKQVSKKEEFIIFMIIYARFPYLYCSMEWVTILIM